MLDSIKAPWSAKLWKNTIKRVLLVWVFALTSQAIALPDANPVPGGIALVAVGALNGDKPEVYFNGRPVAVVRGSEQFRDQWVAVVGLPLSTEAGRQEVRVNGQGQSFEVQAKSYPEQHIKLKTRKHIDLSDADLQRHRGEKKQAQAAFKHFEHNLEPDFAFIKPVEGPYSSPFGLKRFYNGEPRNPHSGLDIAAPTGTPIKSPAQGKVVLTGNFFFNGNVVYIDHGQGVVTMYCHLDRIDVKTGDVLEKGQPLGTVGATGRVTGPHLHWSVSLNNARIDPMLLLK